MTGGGQELTRAHPERRAAIVQRAHRRNIHHPTAMDNDRDETRKRAAAACALAALTTSLVLVAQNPLSR